MGRFQNRAANFGVRREPLVASSDRKTPVSVMSIRVSDFYTSHNQALQRMTAASAQLLQSPRFAAAIAPPSLVRSYGRRQFQCLT